VPSRSVVLAAVGAAFLAGVLVWVYPHDGPHLLVEFAGISLSTFVGAYGAFQLQIRREDAKTLAERAAALRRAQFALVAQSNVLETLRQELAPLRENESRDLRLKALVFFQAIPAIDLTSIEFLLETADPDLPNVLLDCQNKWNSVIGILEQRTRDYRRYLERLAAVVAHGGDDGWTLRQWVTAWTAAHQRQRMVSARSGDGHAAPQCSSVDEASAKVGQGPNSAASATARCPSSVRSKRKSSSGCGRVTGWTIRTG